ncbi:hypothetical protein I3843_01G026500 [Carya illinoinensis]|nr:hypothetical protein I3843_01G026500 [Carya illinoinensis]
MDELPGALGTSASLALRLGQAVFSSASLIFMCLDVDFYSYTSFCYLVIVMGLAIPWSLTLLVVDAYSVFIRCLPRQPRIILVIILGDLVLSFLLLAAASSTASVTDLLHDAGRSEDPTALQTYVVDIRCLPQWHSCVGPFHLLHLSSIFGFFLLYEILSGS